jgi:hypothetical protein
MEGADRKTTPNVPRLASTGGASPQISDGKGKTARQLAKQQ